MQHDFQWGAIRSIAAKIHCSAETLRTWVRQAALQEWWTEPLTAEEAAAECTWKTSTIRRKIGGQLPDAGEPYRPRVRRCDLFAAFTDAPGSPEIDGPDPAEEVLAGMEGS